MNIAVENDRKQRFMVFVGGKGLIATELLSATHQELCVLEEV